jgi:hypothetical protein
MVAKLPVHVPLLDGGGECGVGLGPCEEGIGGADASILEAAGFKDAHEQVG